MVNAGWRFEELMGMKAGDFAFWCDEQAAHARRQEEAAKAAARKGR